MSDAPPPKDHLWKVAMDAEDRIEDLVQKYPSSPIGVDVGTSKLVVARKGPREVETSGSLNAFLPVPYSRFTEATLGQNNIAYYRDGDELIIYGTAAERFANMFNAEARRPMADGLVNPKEKLAMPVLEAIVQTIVPKAHTNGEILAFSVPAAEGASGDSREAGLTYHKASLQQHFRSLGYEPRPINEGLAVIFSELEEQNFTGIGVSCGGGLCNITMAHLSVPSLMFALPKAGDYIDHSVGAVVDEQATRVKVIKEEGLDLLKPPTDKLQHALHIYYEDLVQSLIEALAYKLSRSDKRSERALPLVLAGGTSKPRGFKELFERTLKAHPLPIPISELKVARDPLTATARGAMINAMYER